MFERILNKLNSLYLKRIFFSCGRNFYAHFPSKIINPKNIKIGDNVFFDDNVWLNCPDDKNLRKYKDNHFHLSIGSNSYIGRNCHISAYCNVKIGKKSLFAQNVHISDVTHGYKKKNYPKIDEDIEYLGSVNIGDGCWFGINSVILPNVKIGNYAVVGANSLVNQDVPDNAVVAGSPAKILRYI